MNNKQAYQTLLNSWLQNYQELHDILNSEQLALEKRDFEQLNQTIIEKDLVVKNINQQVMTELTNESGQRVSTLQQLKDFCVSTPALNEKWQNLVSVIEQCTLKNEVNARLITLLNSSTQRTFNLIKGFDPDNNIYNASGNRATVRYSNSSVSA